MFNSMKLIFLYLKTMYEVQFLIDEIIYLTIVLFFLVLPSALSPVSYLRMLQALLDADLASAVVCLGTDPVLVGPRPLEAEEGALYPLGWTGTQCLLTALRGLLLQVFIHPAY